MKIAYTGSHGTGKTTSVFNLAHTTKLENPNKRVTVFHENTSHAPKGQFNKKGTPEAQLWMFTNRIRKEIELTSYYDIVICDRTIIDHIAYTIYMGFVDLADKMFNLAMEHVHTYDQILFKTIKNNNYLTDSSHRDIIDLEYRQNVENFLMRLYEKTGIISTDRFKII